MLELCVTCRVCLRVGVYERVGAPEAHSVCALKEQRIKSQPGFPRLAAVCVRLRGVVRVRSDKFLDQG